MTTGDPTFGADIRELFSEDDREAMRDTFDLWALDDVRGWSGRILKRLEEGTMPCDGSWPPERVALFRRWAELGCPP